MSDAARCYQITGCEHLMVGRGAVADPLLPQRVASLLGIGPEGHAPERPRLLWVQWVRRFIALSHASNFSPGFLPGRIKQWGKMNHLYASGTFYQAIKTRDSTEDILHAMDAWANVGP